MVSIFNQTKVQIAVGALLAATLFSFSHVANAAEDSKIKSFEVLKIEATISDLKAQRAPFARHEQRDLLPQFEKGGPDWKPIQPILMHELDQEIRDYHFLRSNGQAAQSGELHDEMVDLFASSDIFASVPETVLMNMALTLTDKRKSISQNERKVYLNRIRFQLGLSESKHLKGLIEELDSTRAEIAKFDVKIAKATIDLQAQLKLESGTQNKVELK